MTKSEIKDQIVKAALQLSFNLSLRREESVDTGPDYLHCSACGAWCRVGETFEHASDCPAEVIKQLRYMLEEATPDPLVMRVRLKHYPDRWVGKKNPTYAFQSDQEKLPVDPEAFWYVAEKYALVWTDLSALKRVVTASRGYGQDRKQTYSEFEVVFGDGTVKPLDLVLGK